MGEPYDTIAPFYDRAIGGYVDDLPLYEALARRYGSPVLEVGAGAGRVALHLAAAGIEVTALDPSTAMLAIGRDAAAARRLTIDWRQGRIEELTTELRYGLVICALDSFLHLTDADAQRAALAAMAAALRPDGCLALDLPTLAAWAEWEPGARPLELLWSDESHDTGVTTSHLSTFHAEPARQVRHITHIFEEIANDGAVRRRMAAYDLRFVGRFEVELLLERAGLRVAGVHGDYELGPLTDASERMIVLATRPSRGA